MVGNSTGNIHCLLDPIYQINFEYEPYNAACLTELDNIVDYEIIDRGSGILDTIFITEVLDEEFRYNNIRGGGNRNVNGKDDEALLTQAISNKNRKDYNSAINKLKDLIDNYDSSRFINKAVGELYLCYLMKDTGVIQSNTTSLFSELKEYLEDKIVHYASNSSIVQKAYSYYLMCLTKTLNYNEAILGYENIMENHPDTTRQLLASWDRAANVLLQQGTGGVKII